ncbi:MAG: Maf family nucleotide pyrophosphatase [Pseudomonadota bacterium]
MTNILLASASTIRRQLLAQAGVSSEVEIARIDETAIRASLEAEGAHPRDVADALAEAKARKVSGRHPEKLVIGCDQILALKSEILVKAETREAAEDTLRQLRGETHHLYSAAVVYDGGQAVWRHVGVVRLTIRSFSESYLAGYLDRNWPDVSDAVGCYKLEKEGIRLFSQIQGDYFDVLGLPLLPLLSYLSLRGEIEA